MADRRLATDISLALLIAFPSMLPGAPSPWNSDEETGKIDDSAVTAPADARAWAQSVRTGLEEARYGRS